MATGADTADRGEPDVEQRGRGEGLSTGRFRRGDVVVTGMLTPDDLSRINAELGLEGAVIDTGDPDPWALSIAIAIVLFGIGTALGYMGEPLWATVSIVFATGAWMLGVLVSDE